MTDDALRACRQKIDDGESSGRLMISLNTAYLTDEEFRRLTEQFEELVKPYVQPRGKQDELLRRITIVAHDLKLEWARDEPSGSAATAAVSPLPRRTRAMGIVVYSRKDLERCLAGNTRLDIALTGVVVLHHDITPELALQAIRRLSVRGKLIAPQAVREALERKGALMTS